jgi:SAM-dependent methyltransferase
MRILANSFGPSDHGPERAIAATGGLMERGWREYHSRWSDRHWLDRAMEHWEFNRKFHRKLDAYLRPGDPLLDVGCGCGYSAAYFASRGHPVTGIDTDRNAVEEAGAWAGRLSLPARFLAGDIFAYRGAERFRMSYSMGLIEHFSEGAGGPHAGDPGDGIRLSGAMAPTSHSLRTVPPCSVPWTPQDLPDDAEPIRGSGDRVVDSFGAGRCGPGGKGRFMRRCPRWRCISCKTGSRTP